MFFMNDITGHFDQQLDFYTFDQANMLLKGAASVFICDYEYGASQRPLLSPLYFFSSFAPSLPPSSLSFISQLSPSVIPLFSHSLSYLPSSSLSSLSLSYLPLSSLSSLSLSYLLSQSLISCCPMLTLDQE